MTTEMRPIILADPEPRTLSLIFAGPDLEILKRNYRVIELADDRDAFYRAHLRDAHFILGQPALSTAQIEGAGALRAIINVEGNFLDNMDYDTCFRRGIHVLTTSPVFAEPVAEIGLGLALALARDIPAADRAFREGREVYGLEGNRAARLLTRANVGFIGFGDLGRATHRLLAGFNVTVRAHDPWRSPSLLEQDGVIPASLETVLEESDVIFVVAAVTSANTGFLGAAEFARMRPGSGLILLSRAAVVDWQAMIDGVRSGHIRVATDVFPAEPVAPDDPIRALDGMILSAHRAGALDSAFTQMGRLVLEDLDLMSRGLPPQSCKRAERETVSRLRSKPVSLN